MDQINAKFSSIETTARADSKPSHLIFVVANEEKCRLAIYGFTLDFDAKVEKRKPAKPASGHNRFVMSDYSLSGGCTHVFSSHRHNFSIHAGHFEQFRDRLSQIAGLGDIPGAGIQDDDHPK